MNHVDAISIRDVPGGCVIAVKAVPGSSRDRIIGVLGDCLKIATSAAAEKGKANAALAAILAKALGLDKRSVAVASGPTSPRKEFLIAGLTADAVRQRLAEWS
jgi:uncharacterized protein